MKYYLKVLRDFAKFSGRATRSEYWYFVLFNFIIAFILGMVDGLTNIQVFLKYYSFAVLLPSISVGVRRMHDVGKSGWFLLIPIYNLVLACKDGDNSENKYGVDPKLEETN